MMRHTFQSKTKNNFWRLCRAVLVDIISTIAAFLILYWIFKLDYFRNPGGWLFIVVLIITATFRDAGNVYINAIIIDSEKKAIAFEDYNFYEGFSSERIPLNKIRLRINKGLFNRSRITSVCFFSGRWSKYEISASKDNFTQSELESLTAYLESVTTPVL